MDENSHLKLAKIKTSAHRAQLTFFFIETTGGNEMQDECF
jgi:hypothetical protein